MHWSGRFAVIRAVQHPTYIGRAICSCRCGPIYIGWALCCWPRGLMYISVGQDGAALAVRYIVGRTTCFLSVWSNRDTSDNMCPAHDGYNVYAVAAPSRVLLSSKVVFLLSDAPVLVHQNIFTSSTVSNLQTRTLSSTGTPAGHSLRSLVGATTCMSYTLEKLGR